MPNVISKLYAMKALWNEVKHCITNACFNQILVRIQREYAWEASFIGLGIETVIETNFVCNQHDIEGVYLPFGIIFWAHHFIAN